MFKKKSLGEKPRFTVMVIIFLIFIAYIVYLITLEKNIILQVMYAVLLIVFGGAFALSESLRFFNTKAISELIVPCLPEKALAIANKIDKFDIFKSYKKSNMIMRTLIYFDQGKFDELSTLIENESFQSSLESKYIYAYNKFFLALFANDRKGVIDFYKQIQHISTTTIKNKSVPQIYSTDLIAGNYHLYLGELDKASKALNNCYLDAFNNREIAFYYTTLAKLNKAQGNLKLEEKHLGLAKEIAPTLNFVKEYSKA